MQLDLFLSEVRSQTTLPLLKQYLLLYSSIDIQVWSSGAIMQRERTDHQENWEGYSKADQGARNRSILLYLLCVIVGSVTPA